MVTTVANKFFGPSSVDTSLLLSGHWPATQRTLACSSAYTITRSSADTGQLLSRRWPATQRTLACSSANTNPLLSGHWLAP